MGVLEDAIRDHLELKRRHGASDEEVEREEAEALGPVRRGLDQPAEEAQTGLEPEHALEGSDEPPAFEESDEPPALQEPEEPAAEALEEPSFEEPETALDEPPPWRAEADDRPPEGHEVEHEPSSPGESSDFTQETVEYDPFAPEQKPPRDFDFD